MSSDASPLTDEERDSWGSPPPVYNFLDRRYHFISDMCASDENHLHATHWFTKERSCLTFSWAIWAEKCIGVKPYANSSLSSSPILRLLGKRRTDQQQSTDAPPFVFLNCPYSDPATFLEKCALECSRGVGSVLLLKAPNGERYWLEHVDRKAAEVIHIAGRLAYIHPRTRQPCAGSSFGSCIVVYDPRHAPTEPTLTSWISREALYAV